MRLRFSLPSSGSFLRFLSVLALLALACFPVLAHADSSGVQYENAVPTVTGKHHSGTPATSSAVANGGASKPSRTGSGGAGSSSGGSSSGKSNTAGGKGGTGQSSPGNAQQLGTPAGEPVPISHGSGGASPLVPILIAILVLAAISIGAVMIRQRRQRGASGASVSPRAG